MHIGVRHMCPWIDLPTDLCVHVPIIVRGTVTVRVGFVRVRTALVRLSYVSVRVSLGLVGLGLARLGLVRV